MPEPTRWIRLGDLAHTRSGDKGDRSNIGVVANDAAALRLARDPSDNRGGRRIPAADGHRSSHSAIEIPGLHSFNFVVDHALAGGASRSLRLDTQGKALGVVLLEMKIPAPADHSPQSRRFLRNEHVSRHSRRSRPCHGSHHESP